MSEIVYQILEKEEDKLKVIEFIKAFYQEEPGGKQKTDEQVKVSIDWLNAHPQCGTIMVFKNDSEVVGYSILINFYSNEYNGLILNIDELFVAPEYRSRGISTRFIQYLIDTKFNNFVALELEVLPYNSRALKLYENIGFKVSDRSYLMWRKQS